MYAGVRTFGVVGVEKMRDGGGFEDERERGGPICGSPEGDADIDGGEVSFGGRGGGNSHGGVKKIGQGGHENGGE